MLEKLYSKPAFDAVKSSSVPKANSAESARNGKAFQSIYAESNKQESAVESVVQSNKVDTGGIDAADDSPKGSSTGATDRTKQNQADLDPKGGETSDLVLLDAAEFEAPPAPPMHLGVVSISQGGAGNSETPNGAATEIINDEMALTSAADATDQRLVQPTGGEIPVQPTHRSIAELRLTGSQPDTSMPRQSTVSAPISNQPPQASPLAKSEGVENGRIGGQLVQGNPTAVDDAVKNAAVLQQTTQSVRAVETRDSDGLQSVSMARQSAQTMAVMGTAQRNAQGLTDAAQRGMISEQEAQFAAEIAAEAEDVLANSTARPTRQTAASTPVRMAQTVPTAQTSAVQNNVSNAETLLDPLSANLMQEPLSFEPAGLSQLLTEAVMSPGTTHRPETPRLVAVQLAEALAAKGERNIDVALSPEELGRVKMRVSTTDLSVIVTITTERPETGDLMRRHINELAEEFRRMGFEDISFEFGGEGMSGQMAEGGEQDNSPNNGSSEAGPNDATAEIKQEPAQQNLRLGESGLDMRI